jgi:zinc D-Ala-D-Ala dipeptidase
MKLKLVLLVALAPLFALPAYAVDLPPGFVRLSDIAPGIKQDMRYAGADNFTGAAVPGYGAAACWLRDEAARALAAAERDAEAQKFRLVVYDCYRPKRAVAAFFAWSQNGDEKTKPSFFPHLAKSDLFEQGYIARLSGHSTGLAVDIGVLGWDFGTPFDRFDPASWTKQAPTPVAATNRRRLVALMQAHGFANYTREWWHFSLPGPKNAPSYDTPIE